MIHTVKVQMSKATTQAKASFERVGGNLEWIQELYSRI